MIRKISTGMPQKGDNHMRQRSVIILIALLIILFTACSKRDLGLSSSQPPASSGSQSQSGPEENPSSEDSTSDPSPENTAEKYADILVGGTYYIDCVAVIEMDGMQLENPMLIAVQDGNSSISVSSDLSGALVTIRTLVFDGGVYRINDAQRSYTQIDPEQSANSFDTDFAGLQYVGEGTGRFLGETRPCSEYARGEQTIRFFLEDGTLVGLTQTVADEQVEEIMLRINGLSGNIPNKLVELPLGYTKE